MSAVHRGGVSNPNWPLCVEAVARSQGWTTAEIEDGELACGCDPSCACDDCPRISGQGDAAAWFVDRPVDCAECLELVHA